MKEILKTYCFFKNGHYYFNENLKLILEIYPNNIEVVNINFVDNSNIEHYFNVINDKIKLELFFKSLQ